MREASRGVLAQDAMITRFESLNMGSRVEDAVEALIRTTQHEFPVVDAAGRLQGMLTRDEMIKALRERGPDAPVREVMRTDIPLVEQRRSLAEALRPMQEKKLPAAGVVDREGRLIGYITPENVGELMMVQAARGGSRHGCRGSGAWRLGLSGRSSLDHVQRRRGEAAVCLGGGMHQVPEQRPLAGRPTLAWLGEVAEPSRSWIGKHAFGQRPHIETQDRHAMPGFHPVQLEREGVVEAEGSPSGRSRGSGPESLEGRGHPDVRQVGHEQRAGAGCGQVSHGLADGCCGRGTDRVRVRRETGRQQIVAAGPNDMEGARLRLATPPREVTAHLCPQPVRTTRGMGAADRVVGSAGARRP